MCTRAPESVLEPPLFRGTDEPELSYQHPCSLDHREVDCLEKMWLLVVFCLTNEYQRGLLLLVSRVVLPTPLLTGSSGGSLLRKKVEVCLTNEYQRGLLLLVSRVVLVDDPLVVDGHRQVPDAHVATRHSL